MTGNQLEHTLADIHRICAVHQLRYAVIGGVALMAYSKILHRKPVTGSTKLTF